MQVLNLRFVVFCEPKGGTARLRSCGLNDGHGNHVEDVGRTAAARKIVGGP